MIEKTHRTQLFRLASLLGSIALLLATPFANAVCAAPGEVGLPASAGPTTAAAAAPLASLEPLLGGWTGTFSAPPTEWTPAESSRLTAVSHWVLDGHHLQMQLSYTLEERSHEALVLWSYRADTKDFRVYWIDNASAHAAEFKGDWQADGSLLLETTRGGLNRTVNERLRVLFPATGGWEIVSENDVTGDLVEQARLAAVTRRRD
jgi:hypothetical protein